MTIAIVGGGLAAATAVTELRGSGYDGELVLHAAENHLPYERPPLSKDVLLGKKGVESATVRDADWYRDHDVQLQLGTEVTEIDRAGHLLTVRAPGGEVRKTRYDRLLLATGAVPRRFALADQIADPVYLRTMEDSLRLKEMLRPGARIVIVGAGWIGLEVASAARQAGADVTVHEAADLPLVRVLGPEIAQVFADLHRHHGVDLRLGSQVAASDLEGADLVVVGVGAAPATGLAERAGLPVDNGILVDATLRTEDPDVYAIGDVANHDHPVLGRRIRVEHWDTAIGQGETAARNLMGAAEPYTRQPYFFTDQYDLGMEYVGSVGPGGYDRVDIEGSTDVAHGDAFRAYWVSGGKVVAAMHANDWDASDSIRASIGVSR